MLCKRLSVAMVRDPWQPSLTLLPPFPLCYSFLSSHTGTLECWRDRQTQRRGTSYRGWPISVHLNKLLTSPTVHLSPPACSTGPRPAFMTCACIDNDRQAAAEADLRACVLQETP